MAPAEVVRALYEAYQARDWTTAATLLHPDVGVDMPATAESLVGRRAVLEFQCSYPEPWGDLAVRRVVGGAAADDVAAAAEVEVRTSDALFRMAAFWDCRDGLLWRGVEYWVTVGAESPPPGREHHPALPADTDPT